MALTPQAAAGALAGRWSRLHPLSPIPKFAAAIAVLVAVLATTLLSTTSPVGSSGPPGRDGGGHVAQLVDAILVVTLAAFTLAAAVVSWLVTRWRVVGGELQIDTGLIVRQSLRFPLRRVQAVDIVAPLTARLLGLAEVRVVSAGVGHRQQGRLAYMRDQEAAAVRAQLLALAHGLAAETPEPPAMPLFQVRNGRLVAASLLRGPLWVVLAAVIVALALAAANPAAAGSDAAASLFSAGLTALFGVGVEAARFVNTDFDFTIGEAPDGLRLHRGLLQKRHETVPYARVQALRLVRPLLWRPFGWARVELDVARQPGPRRQGESRQVSRLLAPVATLAEATWLISRVMPGAPTVLGGLGSPPRRSVLRVPLSYHLLRVWHDQRYVVTQTGRVRPAVVVIPLAKVQSIRWQSGPLLRALRLADVRIDTAGRRWVGEAVCRDQDEAAALLEELSLLARRARQSPMPVSS
ncbi:MAG: PH domain-containing protein [Candidatus Dormiibacterota bacterium]